MKKTWLYAVISVLFTLFLPSGLLAQAPVKIQAQYYVDPAKGNDSAAGTLAQPFKTLTKAQAAVRTINTAMTGDIVVNLRGGVYNLGSTLNFEPTDGASNGFAIRYQAYQGEQPVISGGKTVSGWVQEKGQKYFSAKVPEAQGYPAYFRQIWVNGIRTRQAASDFISLSAKVLYDDPATPESRDGFPVFANHLKEYTNLADIRIFQEGNFKHVELMVDRIIDLKNGQKVIQMKQPAFKDWFQNYCFEMENSLRVLNAFEELDEPGEFYLNQATDTLYYYPQHGEDLTKAEVVVPSVEFLVKLNGTKEARLAGLSFEGIGFRYGNWTDPATKEIGRSQADLDINYRSIPGQFQLNYTDAVQIKNCRFEFLASTGLYLNSDNRKTLIQGSVFNDLTAAGIIIGDSMANYKNDTSNKDTTIRNNVVRNIGSDYYQSSGIYANGSKNLTIVNNDVADVAYFGINQRYGDSKLKSEVNDFVGNTQILNNRVTNFGTAVKYGFGIGDEIAGIYLFGVKDSRVAGNYVRNGGRDERLEGSLRQDQYGVNNVWENNVAESRPVKRSFSYYPASTQFKIVFQNNFANWDNEFKVENNITWTNNSVELDQATWSAPAQAIIAASGLEKASASLLNEFGDGTNIALKGKATSSSEASADSSAAKALDNNYQSAWVAMASPAGVWWKVELDQAYRLSKIQLVPQSNAEAFQTRRNFQVQVSNDGDFKTYKVLGGQDVQPFAFNVAKTAEVKMPSNSWDMYVNDVNGYRFLRVVGEAISLGEVRIYGTPTKTLGQTTAQVAPQWDVRPVSQKPQSLIQRNSGTAPGSLFNDLLNWWVGGSGSVVKNDAGEIVLKTPPVPGSVGYASFQGSIFGDELLKFNMKIDAPSSWHTLWIRAQDNIEYSKNDVYMLLFGAPNAPVQLHRFNKGGIRDVLIGEMTGKETLIAKASTTFSYGVNHVVEVGAINEANGVRIILNVDGQSVINALDTFPGQIREPGYLGFNARSGSITISEVK